MKYDKYQKYDFKKNRIKALRQLSGLTQRFLSNATGISQANLCRWENGANKPNIADCWRLADYFGVSIDYLSGRTDK